MYQPDAISCGPTCIKMTYDFLNGNLSKIDDICLMCETDDIIGTTPHRMILGLDQLNIKYNKKNGFEELHVALDNGNPCILRTFTQQIPHWVVVIGYENKKHNYYGYNYIVNDPWLGQLVYNENELNNIWKDRDYYFFEILSEYDKSKIKIEKIKKDDIDTVLKIFKRSI